MSGERILVVDDSKQIVQHLAEQVLPTFGFQTLTAADGRSGLTKIRQSEPDLVMLDLNLPDMTGLDVLRKMIQESINIPVVLMTGYGSEKSAIEAFRLGVKDYIIKPFSIDELLETINRALMEKRLRNDKQKIADQLRRTHAEMRRRVNEMSTLFGIGKAVASLLSMDKILDRVLEAAGYLTNAENSTIWLRQESDNKLYSYARKGSTLSEPTVQSLSVADSHIGQVLQSGRSLREASFSGKGIKVKTGYTARAILYVPLMLRGEAIGVLTVSNHSAPRSFSEQDESLLMALADYAAIALENARTFRQADQALADRMEELQTLIQVTQAITSSLDLHEIVQLTIEQVHKSWRIEASSLWLLEKERQILRLLANVGTPADILRKFEVPLGQGFVGRVAQTRRPLYTNDVTNHPLHYRAVDRKTGFKTNSLLCVPLIFRDEVIGVLQLLNKFERGFDEQDLERARSIATAVAIAVSNALLFQQSESREQQLAATLEHNGNPIIIIDKENKLLLLNQQARQRFKVTPAVIGRRVTNVLNIPELTLMVEQPLAGESRRTELTLPDDSVWLATLAPIPDYGRIFILQDITYLKELDRAKSNFVATVSHDMRDPLATIDQLAHSLAQAGPLNGTQKKHLARIMKQSGRLMKLVSGLLDLAKAEAQLAEMEELCDVTDLAQQILHELQAQAAKKGVSLQLHKPAGPLLVQGDSALLKKAITNLVDNAIKYSLTEQPVQIDLIDKGDAVLIQVKDLGIGIAPIDMPQVFNKFFRADEGTDGPGLGLGLTFVQSVAEAHAGQVWVESEPGSGSTFVLTLPLSQAVEADFVEEE